jgi:hypothetical protein
MNMIMMNNCRKWLKCMHYGDVLNYIERPGALSIHASSCVADKTRISYWANWRCSIDGVALEGVKHKDSYG